MKLKRGKFYNYARVKIRYLTHSTDDSFLLKEICNLAIYEKKNKKLINLPHAAITQLRNELIKNLHINKAL